MQHQRFPPAILAGAGRDYMWIAVRKFLGMGLEMFAYTLANGNPGIHPFQLT